MQTEELVKRVRYLMGMGCSIGAIINITKQSKSRVIATISAINMVKSNNKKAAALRRKQYAIEAQLAVAKLDRAYAKVGAKIQPDGKVKLREPA